MLGQNKALIRAHRKKATSKNLTIESLSLKLDMKYGPCVDKVKSDNNFLTADTPSENLIQKPVLERSSLAFYNRIGLIRARQRFELIFHLHTRFVLRPNHGYRTNGNYFHTVLRAKK